MENCGVHALSRVIVILHTLEVSIIGFERVKDVYSMCQDFVVAYASFVSSD